MRTRAAAVLIAMSLAACGHSGSAVVPNSVVPPSVARTAGGIGGGGGDAAAAAAAKASASTDCLLTGAQVSGVMGATYGEPINAYGNCRYVGVGGAVTIHVARGSSAAAWAQAVATLSSDRGSAREVTIAGLGDKALAGGRELSVAAAGHIIDVRDADTAAGTWPRSIALARLVIARLR